MESAVYSTKQIKIFGKIYQEFLDNYNNALGVEKKVFKVKKTQVLLEYLSDCNKNLDSFLDCNESVLGNFSILKVNGIDPSKTKINWEYLHNLFFVVNKSNSHEVIEKSKKGIQKSKEISKELTTANTGVEENISGLLANNAFGDLIKEMSVSVKESLEGKDLSKINPMELLSGLLNPENNGQVGGVDFSQIINKTVGSLKEKINNKEINISELKDIASSVSNSLGDLKL
jgi:hypothetical protein